MAPEESPRDGAPTQGPGQGPSVIASEVHIDSVDSCLRTEGDEVPPDPSLFQRVVDSVLRAIGLLRDEDKRRHEDERECLRADDQPL